MRIPDRFLAAIDGDPGNCVLIVGAGLSKKGVRRGGGGIPDWDELMRLMITHLREAGRCAGNKLDALAGLLKEDPPRYPDVAEEFWLAHTDDRDGYRSVATNYFERESASDFEVFAVREGAFRYERVPPRLRARLRSRRLPLLALLWGQALPG